MSHPAPASLGRRAAAFLLDQAVALVLGGGVVLAVALRTVRDLGADPAATPTAPGLLLGAWALLLVQALVQWWTHGTLGWTLGRRLLGLRTVDARTGRPLGLARVLLRGLVVAAGSVVVVGSLVVLASPLLDRTGRGRGWHDRVAGGEVVDLRTVEGPLTGRRDGGRAPRSRAVTPVRPRPAARPTADEDWSLVASAPAEEPVRPADPQDVAGRRLGALLAERRTTGPSLVLPPLGEPGVAPDVDTRAIPMLRPAVFALDPALEETRRSPLRADERPAPAEPLDPRAVALELSDGRTVTVDGAVLVGRNPVGTGTEQLVRVVDPGRSVSKTHLQLGLDERGLWVADRGSTNGTLVTLADGQQIVCGVDQRVRVPLGSTVSFGDCGLRVVPPPVERRLA
ncbi:RDD family protein [Cellulomonas cellasea]|uniref:Putative RDD family membrane protein YckC n=1 Tax=Cellulomonas cellasea TaxID=43670 RepID=A0A7W4UC14_9CELL|nr:RDD family protein [Cellulomonas cellasea]MBB2921417.1 putative RDD family membrane protein YckC [Cellulomonas cellasea]